MDTLTSFDLNQRLRPLGLHIPMLECCDMLPIGLLYLVFHTFLRDCDAQVPPCCCLHARLLKKLRKASLCKGVQLLASHLSDVLDEGKLPFVPETEQPEKKDERVRVCRPSSLLAAS
jgi:hypothetical protein